mgnify:FL=1
MHKDVDEILDEIFEKRKDIIEKRRNSGYGILWEEGFREGYKIGYKIGYNIGYGQVMRKMAIGLAEEGYTVEKIAMGMEEDVETVKKWLQQKDDIK